MKTLAKALLVLLALLPVGILLWLAVPQIPLLWDNRAYWRGYAVSLGLTAVILLFQLAVALPAAYGLARWRGRLRDAAYLLYCLLTLLPVQVMLLPNYLVCRALGLLNTQLAIVLLGGILSAVSFPVGSRYAAHRRGAERGCLAGRGRSLDDFSLHLSAAGKGHRPYCRGAGISGSMEHGGAAAGAAVR